MNRGVILGVSLLVLLVLAYMYTSSGSSVTVSKEHMQQASRVIVAQLEQEAREALPLQLQSNVTGLGLDETVRGELLSILKQDLVTESPDFSNVGSTPGMLGTTETIETTDPLPGTKEYNTITFQKLQQLSGIGGQTWNIHALPGVDEDKLMSMMVYSTERGLPRQAKVHSEVIAYKRLLALGQEMDVDFSEFSPNLATMTSSDLPLASMDIDQMRSVLAVFQFPPQHRASFKTIIDVIKNLIEQVENDATQAEIEALAIAHAEANEQARANAAPGSTLYLQVTDENLRSIAGKEFPMGSDTDLPRLELSVLEELLEYAISRSDWKQSLRFANTIAYKKVLAIGEKEGINLRDYSPNLKRFSAKSVDFSKVSIETRNEFLAAFEADHGIPVSFTKTAVIDEIKRSISEDAEFVNTESEAYRQETMDHVLTLSGEDNLNDIMGENGFYPSLDMDFFIQVRDYASSREDSILETKADDAIEWKNVILVGEEIGADFSSGVGFSQLDLNSLSVSDLVKLENVLKSMRVIPDHVSNFLKDVTTVKDRKSQEAIVSQNLAEEAEADAQEEAQAQAQQEAESPQENEPDQPIQQQEAESLQENEPEQPAQQEPELTEAINNIRSDKTGRVGVEMRQNDNGSVFIDLSVPSDITPSDSDEVKIFFTSESWSTLNAYQSVFSKIKDSKSLEGLTTEEINTISSAGVVFDDISKSYVRQMKGNITKRVESL